MMGQVQACNSASKAQRRRGVLWTGNPCMTQERATSPMGFCGIRGPPYRWPSPRPSSIDVRVRAPRITGKPALDQTGDLLLLRRRKEPLRAKRLHETRALPFRDAGVAEHLAQ